MTALSLTPPRAFSEAAPKKTAPKRAKKAAAKQASPQAKKAAAKQPSPQAKKKAAAAKPTTRQASKKAPAKRTPPANHVIRGGPWDEPTFADSTLGDYVDGEDLHARRAAVEALGPYNGSVVVVDPSDGRILTMVNQRLALGSGFQPCSTIKVPVALAALSEGVLKDPTTALRGHPMDLTQAMAYSNNAYFANVGMKLGFAQVRRYARLFGYGEKAGLNIPGEQAGGFPSAPPRNGGVGMLCSFGEEISQTPLQLAALMAALANGGTLYYLQHPRSQLEVETFEPRIKRRLEIADLIPAIKPGMLGAVEFGTARRALQEEAIAGKTGTCTESRTHLGWFGSFSDTDPHKLAVVVLLTGGRPSVGSLAAQIAGQVYKNLAEHSYVAQEGAAPTVVGATQCCAP